MVIRTGTVTGRAARTELLGNKAPLEEQKMYFNRVNVRNYLVQEG